MRNKCLAAHLVTLSSKKKQPRYKSPLYKARCNWEKLGVSDTCYNKQKEDKSGPALVKCILESFPESSHILNKIVPDELDLIEAELINLSQERYNIVLTTGGTGLSPRDVTPEATRRVITKEATGISIGMITKSLQVTDMAMLSRAVCGYRGETLIVNLPGSAKGATECFNFIKSCLKHAVHLLTDKQDEIKKTHDEFSPVISGPSQVKVNQVAMRNRQSPYKMLEVEDALKLIYDNTKDWHQIETIKIEDSLNRILAENVYMPEPFPPFRASIKDGYAVRSADGAGVRDVQDVTAAGDDPRSNEVKPGSIVRISTGAAVPLGADAVVQVEDTELVVRDDQFKEVKIRIYVAPSLGQDIREIGSDIRAGELVLNKFYKIKASHIGVLALIGRSNINVFRRPSIGVVSTGNELRRHDEELRSGHIRDSNKLTLLNLLMEYGYMGRDCGIARDNPDSVKRTIAEAFEQNDFLITTGGVSMGEFDLIKEVLEKISELKPTTFATCTYKNNKKFIFGLPGNPVSANVTFLLFVLPAIKCLENQKPYELAQISVVMEEDVKLDPRPEYRRVRLERSTDNKDNIFTAYSTGNQISSRLNSFVGAYALAIMPSIATYGSKILKKGANVQAMVLDLNF
ncbi:molybdopterin biosynthesis protein [Holotrichia oblita]|uniref:Molybdopterin biosynthesis protein n=1 Tax=Holotrichia oblita TaxID=644536 RepID=A0ACB9T6B2_HOLOL|nr:molybdopterin biosynthesis protein [Holotrichia oblita]